jgi:hypothetical protein
MSAWRRTAIESFPELASALNDSSEIFSPYALWFELLPMVRAAHRSDDHDLLGRIYSYADWSLGQGAELRNAVAVSFYEHLFDEKWMRPVAAERLSPRAVDAVRPLWVARLSTDDLDEVDNLLRR